MKKENFRLGGYILMILGIIGFISGTSPIWAVISVFGLGVILISMTTSKKN